MADIAMCLSENCDRRDRCYRIRAKPDKWQTFADLEKVCKKENYKYYIDGENKVLAVK